MYDDVKRIIDDAVSVLIIQPENPDGDSLGSAMALEEILGDMGKKVMLYCKVQMPKHLHFINGWDRVTDEWPKQAFDTVIIVDTASKVLLDKALTPDHVAAIKKSRVIVFDHHATASDLPFDNLYVNEPAAATGELLFKVGHALQWPINPQAAEHIAASILADTLGLTTPSVTAATVQALGEVVAAGASLNTLENRRREYLRKSPDILAYKGRLLQRVEYHADGQLALVHIPWDEIHQYSNQYNPGVLVIDEMRLVEGVRVAVAIKTYPDGKLTGKLRSNSDSPVCETIAQYFGAGGHAFAAGFRVYDSYDVIKPELIGAVHKILRDYDAKNL